MDIRTTGIIGRASAVRINYRKWVGPSIDTTDPSHFEFQVWCSSVAWFWRYSTYIDLIDKQQAAALLGLYQLSTCMQCRM